MSNVAPTSNCYVLANASVPVDLLAGVTLETSGPDRLAVCDIRVAAGRIDGIGAAGSGRAAGQEVIDLKRGIVLPRLVDMHTHIDKGHIWLRSPNPDGTHTGARVSVAADREARWTADDVRARMDFALRSAYAHGTGALRTHIDSLGKQAAISWPVFAEMREAWRGRMELQAVALYPVDVAVDDEPQFKALAATVARHGGLLGGLTFTGAPPDAKLDLALDRIFAAASAHGLDVDLHVDESDSANARSLEPIALAAQRHKFKGRVVVGHCCSLALQSDADRARVIARVGEADIAVVSLPMCNMYLQDRTAGRTPRWRGVTPLHELDAAGVGVAIASDNTRDPFYAYGDLDMLEAFREATRILHFDHSDRAWLRLLGAAPADIMGLKNAGRITLGGAADMIVIGARTLNELHCRPWSDRTVLIAGKAIERKLPAYVELDALGS